MNEDPYRYFRIEAQELVEALSRDLLGLARGEGGALAAQLLRAAHTLKGAARVVGQSEIGDLAHAIEELIAPHRDEQRTVARDTIDQAFALVDEVHSRLGRLDEPASPVDETSASLQSVDGGTAVAGTPPAGALVAGTQAVTVAVAELDRLAEALATVTVAATALAEHSSALDGATVMRDRAAHPQPARSPSDGRQHPAGSVREPLPVAKRSFAADLNRLTRGLADLDQSLSELRLIPAQVLLADLERATRDAAETLDKRVEFETTGGEIRIDAHILHALRTALRHVVRNAVAHGIEPPAERERAGKPHSGRVTITLERLGSSLSVRCSDDGRGIDEDALRRAAVARGFLAPATAEQLDGTQLVRMLLHGGLTTTARVDDVSGRGVGLDTVRATMEAVRGEVTIGSVPGIGTTVQLVTPLAASSLSALVVEVDRRAVAIPLGNVRRTMRVTPDQLVHAPGVGGS